MTVLAAAPTMSSDPYLYVDGGKLLLNIDRRLKFIVEMIPGRTWDAPSGCWRIPPRPENLSLLKSKVTNLQVLPGVLEMIMRQAQQAQVVAKEKDVPWQESQPLEPMPLRKGVKPFQHQISAYNIVGSVLGIFKEQTRAAGCGGALLMEQGCGKTLTAIAIASRGFQNGYVRKVLIFAPASVVPVWSGTEASCGEFDQFCGVPYEVKALTGPVKKRADEIHKWKENAHMLQVAVTNYEASWRMDEFFLHWHPDMVICDESQRIKSPGARQTKAVVRIGASAPFRLILTGTPVGQGPLDFFSQYKFLNPEIFGSSYLAFRNRYATMGGFEGRQVIAYQNLEELTKKAHSVAFRITKEEALDLPEFVDQSLFCELESTAMSTYKQMAKEQVAELTETKKIIATNVLSKMLRLSQITGGYYRDENEHLHQVSTAKINLLKETLGDLLDAGKKVVVFARFLPEIAAIEQYLADSEIDHGCITGAVPIPERGKIVEKFQTDPNCRVFVAQSQTAGLGITLTAADTCIFYSLDYSYITYDQCRSRIHRIGQKNTCTYIHLLARGTIDEKVLGILRGKKSLADMVVDHWRDLLNV